jgi:hypothetical protein
MFRRRLLQIFETRYKAAMAIEIAILSLSHPVISRV